MEAAKRRACQARSPALTPSPTPGSSRLKTVWKPAVTLIAMACLLLLLREFQVTRSLLNYIAGWKNQPGAALVFLLIGIPYSLLGLPRQALCLVAGMVFGVMTGFVLATIASLLGAVLGFAWMQRLASPALRARMQARFRGRLELVGQVLARSPFQAILTLRLLPVGSAIMVTVAAGLYGVPLGAFAWATLLGALPQNLVFVLVGAGARLGEGAQIGLGIALFAGSSLLAWILLARARREGSAIARLAETSPVDENS